MWCGWGSSRCGPNDVFHTSHLFLSPTLPPPLRSISLFSTIWLESIFKSKPYFGRGGTVSVSVPGFSVWTGFGNRRLFYLISRSSSFSHGRDFLQFSHQHQPSTSSFSSRPPRSHMWCSLSESGFFLCTRKCTIVSGTCSHFTCEVSRVCPPSAPDSSEWRRHQAFPVARTSPVTDAVQTRPLCSPGTKHKWVLCFVAQSSREAWASSTNLRRGCPACPPPHSKCPVTFVQTLSCRPNSCFSLFTLDRLYMEMLWSFPVTFQQLLWSQGRKSALYTNADSLLLVTNPNPSLRDFSMCLFVIVFACFFDAVTTGHQLCYCWCWLRRCSFG